MTTSIFVNLPVASLERSQAFFRALGFEFDSRYTGDDAACLVLGEAIYAMLLTRERFAGFTPNPVCDARLATEMLVCLSCESRAQVDERVRLAVQNGGNTYNEAQDHVFMYGHGFQDPDGHIWELIWLDPAQAS
jgi:predicted lactoylglutathione lyase